MKDPEQCQRIISLTRMLTVSGLAAGVVNACLNTGLIDPWNRLLHCNGFLLSGGISALIFLCLAWLISRDIRNHVYALNQSLAQGESNRQAAHKLMLEQKAAAESLAITNEQLRESEERFRLIAENVSDLIAVVNPAGIYLYSSPSVEQLGYSPEELFCTSYFTYIHPDDAERSKKIIETCVAKGIAQMWDYRRQQKDGSWRSLEAFVTPVRNARGKVEHLVIVMRDITERKDAESKRRHLEVHLRHAQKMESIGQLAAGIAHEINTPTQYIRNNVLFLRAAFSNLHTLRECYDEMLQAVKTKTWTEKHIAEVEQVAKNANVDYLKREIPNAIQDSLKGIDRITKIVRAMKEFSHPASNQKNLADLNKTIDSTLTVCRNEWKYVANLVTQFDKDLPLVPCHAGEINQAILNIVVNAAHAIADVVGDGGNGKGTITVSTKRDGQWAEIRISDTGTGIPEGARDHVFDPFFTTKEVGKGTGQGLAIAHSIVVKKHGGTVTFETGNGVGTTFIIRLPLNSLPEE